MRIFEISDFDSNFTTNTWTQSSGNGSFAFINDNKYESLSHKVDL